MKRNDKIFFGLLIITEAVVIYLLIRNEKNKKYSASMFSPSEHIKDYIKKAEGLRLTPYWDGKASSIGYGHQIKPDEQYLMNGITEEKADQLFEQDIKIFSNAVNANVSANISQSQFDALVDFAYNMGIGAFSGSTLLRLINQGAEDQKIEDEFNRWIYADGEPNGGLKKRRQDEINLYFA